MHRTQDKVRATPRQTKVGGETVRLGGVPHTRRGRRRRAGSPKFVQAGAQSEFDPWLWRGWTVDRTERVRQHMPATMNSAEYYYPNE